jgi:hypothetical protein
MCIDTAQGAAAAAAAALAAAGVASAALLQTVGAKQAAGTALN